MGYPTTVQLIAREKTEQWYVNFPGLKNNRNRKARFEGIFLKKNKALNPLKLLQIREGLLQIFVWTTQLFLTPADNYCRRNKPWVVQHYRV